MIMMKRMKWSLLLLSYLHVAHAVTPVNDAKVVSASKQLATMVPTATSFTVATAGTYTLTLTDVQKNSPGNGQGDVFSSLSVVVSQGSQLIKNLVLPTALPTINASLTLAAGQYQVQVLGITSGISQYGVELKDASNVSVWTDSAVVTAPATDDFSSLQQTLTLVAGQSYTVTLSDRIFPTALTALQASIVQAGNVVVCSSLIAAASSATCTFTASNISNQLVVVAEKAASGAGLYSVKVTNNTTGAVAYAATLPLGAMPDPVAVNLPAVDGYSLSSIDFSSPAALSSFKLALVQGGELLAKQTATGAGLAFNGATGTADLYVIANAAVGAAGMYSVIVTRAGSPIANVVDAVTDRATTGLEGFQFSITLPTAGNYSLQLHDFAFPQALSTLSASASRNGVVLGTLSAQGTLSITNAAAGELNIAVLAKPGTAGAAGLFGINLAASGSATPLLEKTQGVGGGFTSRDVTVSAADHFLINATDFAAPAALNQLRVVMTRGSNLVGSIFGGGSFGFDATPGIYTLSFISTAQSSAGYGMYGVSMATAPTVTLSANPTSVISGNSSTLTWSAADASTCAASGGWSGNKAISGTATVGPLSTNTTYTLTCTGVGGSAAKSTTVTIQAATDSSSGGGGTTSLLFLCGLSVLGGLRQLRARGH
jgi:hypothetical protein